MKKIPSELANVYVVLFNSLGVTLTIKSGLGISPFSAVPYAFNLVFENITIGTFNYSFQLLLVIILMVLRKKFVPSYFVSFIIAFFFGIFMDLHELWVTRLPLNTALSVIYFAIGYLLVAAGIAMENRSGLTIMATDLFSRDLSEITRISFSKVKISFDVICLILTCVITYAFTSRIQGIGIGTAVMAFTLGKAVSSIGEIMDSSGWTFVRFKELRKDEK